MHIPKPTFEKILLESGLVTKDDIALAYAESLHSGKDILDTLVSLGKMSDTHVAELLHDHYGYPIVDVRRETIDPENILLLPQLYMKGKRVVVLTYDKENNTATLGMVDPGDYDAIVFVEKKLGVTVSPRVITPTSLAQALKQYKKETGISFDVRVAEGVEAARGLVGREEDAAKSIPVTEMLDAIIEHAIALSASDIHLEPLEHSLVVRFRIDGVMQEVATLPKDVALPLTARVKILASLRIDEHRAPQDGRFRASSDGVEVVDIRVNVMPIFHGEKVEMRLLRSAGRPITFRELGFGRVQESILAEEVKKPHGMVLVTGPTGHGKTTTLYAILNLLNSPKVNITTIEDPIEYEFPRVNQTQVNPKAGITFANGLRSLLRQNPDIIMIGEIRDDETMDIGVHAALTGHLVLSSLHTNDAPSALPRLIDMGAEPFLLSSTINAIVAQRLVRRICTSCIYSYKTPPDVARAIKNEIKVLGDKHIKKIPESLYKGKGCPVCGGTGFQGQVGIFEILQMNENIRDLTIKGVATSKIRLQAIKDGMVTMFEDGLTKVEQGVTTVEELLRVVRE